MVVASAKEAMIGAVMVVAVEDVVGPQQQSDHNTSSGRM